MEVVFEPADVFHEPGEDLDLAVDGNIEVVQLLLLHMSLLFEVVDVCGEHLAVAVEVILHFALLVNAVDFKQLGAVANQHWVFPELLFNGVRLLGELLGREEGGGPFWRLLLSSEEGGAVLGLEGAFVEGAALAALAREAVGGGFRLNMGLGGLACLCGRGAQHRMRDLGASLVKG